ncbi:MAG: patatin-like phospholipase RssA [Hylemonella sp.]|nr:patatin-like phospholipase RssA [Hylemonella sp.]
MAASLGLQQRPLRIGLALGSGSARGWAHIGVIRALERAGIVPDIVCGTSIGALVGAVYAAGELDRLEPWVKTLTWKSVLGLMDFRMGGGLIEGGRLTEFFRSRYEDRGIGGLRKAYACVATELYTGREIWLREGPVIDAVRASIALPGLFTPAQHDGRLLVDGGLVNPVPVSLCRAMGADVVIAVDLNWDMMLRHNRVASHARDAEADAAPQGGMLQAMLTRLRPAAVANGREGLPMPSMLDVLTSSLNIMQMRITQSRMAGEPADVLIRPRLEDVAAMDYHLAVPTIAEGERAAEFVLPHLRDLLG